MTSSEPFEDAFNEWPNRQPSTLEDWQALAFGLNHFEPWQILTVVEDADGVETILGACRVSVSEGEGWVDQIAIRREARGPRSVSPLTWSHSTFVATVHSYLTKLKEL